MIVYAFASSVKVNGLHMKFIKKHGPKKVRTDRGMKFCDSDYQCSSDSDINDVVTLAGST